MLAGFLGHVRVGAEANAIGEGEVGSAYFGIDQIIPILEADGKVVDGSWSEDRGKGEVGEDEVVDGEVAFGGIDLS
jgi:hypothetical protein